MSRIDALIAEVCPAGVEHLPLGEVASATTGTQLNRSTLADDGPYAVYNGGIGPSGRHTDFNMAPEKVIVSQGGASAGYVNFVREPFWAGAHCYVLQPTSVVAPRFLYHALKSRQEKLRLAKLGAGIPGLSRKALLGIPVPIPPLEVQREIVRVLDTFTELEAELERELKAREHQYIYYRSSLLTAGDAVPLAALGDLFEMRAGSFVAAAAISSVRDAEHPYPCFGGGGLRGYVAEPNQNGDRVLIGRQGALCGNVKRSSGEFYATEHAVVVAAHPEVDICWAFHVLTAMNLNQYASKSAQPGLAVGNLERLRIPVPTYREQRRIGSILDAFYTLVNDRSIGLPAELDARRKQYEHYRDRLLTFPEAA